MRLPISITFVFCMFLTVAQAQETCDSELNYEDADIRVVVDEIAVRTGRTFLLDPAVQGRVTIKSPPNGGICAEETWELFQAMLRVNDFAALPIGQDKYKIIPSQDAARSGGEVGGDTKIGEGFVTQIVRLRYIDAREAAANLAQIIGVDGVVSPVRSGNSVILVDTASNVERLRKVLMELDRDTTIYRTIALDHASAADVTRIITELGQQITEESGGGGSFSVVPVDASNSILIRAEPSLVRRLAGVVAELDRSGGISADLSVTYLNHTDAEEMAPLLSEVANGAQAPGVQGVPAPINRTTISFHKPTNAIIINGDASIQRTLQNVIAKLDIRRSQVLVEAIIVEVSDVTARELGLQYFLSGTEGSRIPFSGTSFAGAQPDFLAAAGSALLGDDNDQNGNIGGALTGAALSSLLGANGFALGGVGTFGNNSVFGAILTAIQNDTTSDVLSTPSVVTLDNQTARLQVGQEIPITTGEALGNDFSNAFRTVTREEVGVILEVTPQINEGDSVTLEIIQEISSIAGPLSSSSNDLITNKREISTTALVDNGDILVIGGLIDETRSLRESKVPLLGDLPGIGNLFKTTSREKRRSNLMVFIRPTIIRDRSTAQAVTRKKLDYVRAQELLRSGDAQTDIDRLIREVTGVDAASEGQ